MTHLDVQQAMQLGLQLFQAGKIVDAEQIFSEVLALQPEHADALQALGVIAFQNGRFDSAVHLLRKSVQVAPSNGYAFYNLGNALRDSGRAEEAITSFREAIRLQPNFANAYHNLANVLRGRGLLVEAISNYREALRLNPEYAEAHNSMGMAFDLQASGGAAVECYRNALRIDPNYVHAHNNLGVALSKRYQLDEAVVELRRATEIKADYSQAWHSLGHVLRELGMTEEALACFERAIHSNPHSSDLSVAKFFTANYRVRENSQSAVIEHRVWADRFANPIQPCVGDHPNDRSPERRLRIGYVSADFRAHSVAHFISPLLRWHNSEQVEVFAYSNVKKPDAATDRIKEMVHQWHDILDLCDEAAVELMLSHRIDILVDLSGHTNGNRLGVFARKPAPIQVTYLGYPNTTGLTAMDYRLTDDFADPFGTADHLWVEKLWRLPDSAWCYQPPDDSPDVQIASRTGMTFGSFNATAKISSESLDMWAELLKAVPESRILFKSAGTGAASARARILSQFALRGISSDRLEMAGHLANGREHLEFYHRLDVALDTYPYHGTTTTCEALWMGVPVVTLAGQTHVSRVGVSLLSNVGLPELVAENAKSYVRIAAELAADPAHRKELRQTMRTRMLSSPMMNAPRFARNVEEAYRAMWKKWCSAPAI